MPLFSLTFCPPLPPLQLRIALSCQTHSQRPDPSYLPPPHSSWMTVSVDGSRIDTLSTCSHVSASSLWFYLHYCTLLYFFGHSTLHIYLSSLPALGIDFVADPDLSLYAPSFLDLLSSPPFSKTIIIMCFLAKSLNLWLRVTGNSILLSLPWRS